MSANYSDLDLAPYYSNGRDLSISELNTALQDDHRNRDLLRFLVTPLRRHTCTTAVFSVNGEQPLDVLSPLVGPGLTASSHGTWGV